MPSEPKTRDVQLASGSAKAPTPSMIAASAKARESFARVLIGGGVLVLLTLAYLVALACKLDAAQGVLPVIGTGLGFLLGQGRQRSGND
jgi:hypothetical protein